MGTNDNPEFSQTRNMNFSDPAGYPQSEEQQVVNWRKYVFLILSNWYWFLLALFISIGIAYIKNRYTLPSYSVSATLLIEDDQNVDDIMSEFRSIRYFRNRTELANEIAKLSAFSIHRRTIDSLNWNIMWTGHGRVAAVIPIYKNRSVPFLIETDSTSSDWYLNKEFKLDIVGDSSLTLYLKNKVDTTFYANHWVDLKGWKFRISLIEKPTLASYSFIAYDPNTLAAKFRKKIQYKADNEMGTIINLTSTGNIPAMEIDYINMLCENYIDYGLERKRLIAENTLSFIDDQISIIRDSLQEAESSLLYFRLNNNAIDLSKEGQMAYEKLNSFFKQKNQLTFSKNYYNYLTDYIKSNSDPQAIITPTLIGSEDPLLMEQVQELQKLYNDRELYSFSASEKNLGLVQINSQIETAKEKLLQILDGLSRNNELMFNQIKTEENNIEKQLLTLPVNEQKLLNIERKYEVINQFYTFLLQKQAEVGIQRASVISKVRILDRADSFNVTPVGTKKTTIYLMALILGLFIPLGIIFLNDFLDTRVKELGDIHHNTDLPILGIIAHDKTGNQLPVYNKPGSAFAESFRLIRTNLGYILKDPKQNVLMITSTISGEGKSFIALNLASILAMTNKKVVLCGMDLRRPTLHKIFDFTNNEGLSRVLIGKEELNNVITETPINGLYFLPSGPIPPNPAELLGSEKMKEVMLKLKEQYDYVIIDTPPMALVTDAQLISKYADTNIFVVRQHFSRREMFKLINDIAGKLPSSKSLVINDVKESKVLGYYYGYGYGYEYGYGYGYGYTREYGADYFGENEEE